MKESDALRPEWLAFEKELGFRPLLLDPDQSNTASPDISDITAQDVRNGEALLAKYGVPERDTAIKTVERETSSCVRLKAYIPPNLKPDQPLVYFIHGGGFVLGSVDQDDRFVNRHCKDTGLVFVSVEYRLAPMHKFPAGLDDCVQGAKWCIDNAQSLGVRKGPIVIMGKSAGGCFAYATALRLVDEGRANDILGVIPCQPITVHPGHVSEDLKDKYTAFDENAEYTVNTKDSMYALYDFHGAPVDDPYVWPLLHQNLKALPRVYMNGCGADTLRDDARLMRDKLDELGVPNQYEEYARLPHYFFAFPSTHLNKLRDDYFARTAKGIEWIVKGSETSI